MKTANISLIILLLLCILVMVFVPAPVTKGLWKGLVVEAVSEGYIGMKAVACVFKNRLDKDMPLGCKGLKRKDLNEFIIKQGGRYELISKRIINEVFVVGCRDITNGATHYENVKAFGTPYWAKDMKITAIIGNHTFYTE